MRSKRAGGQPVASGCLIAAAMSCGVVGADQQTVTWLGGNSTWFNAAQWSGGVVPSNNGTTTYQVHVDGGNAAASNVTFVSLMGPNVSIDSLTIDPGDTVKVQFGTLQVNSGLVVNGTLNPDYPGRVILGDGQVSGSGTIRISTQNHGLGAMSGALTIGPGLTLRGGSGPFSDQYLSGEPNIGSDASPLINQGHIVADGLHSLLIVGGSTINNQGTLEVTNGATLAIDAAFSLATIGTLVNNGGAFAIRNSFDNTGQTLQIDNAHGWWLGAGSPFNPATIHGGTIETHDGKGLVIPYENTGQLDAVVLNGKVILDGNLIVPSGQTFTGNGEIAIDNPEAIEGSGNVGTASGKTSIGAGVLVHGGIDSSFDFSPGFKAAVGNDREILDNLGTISVDENGKQMYLIGSTINNSGVLEVVSGAQLRVFGDLIFFDESRLKIDGGGSVNIDNTILSGVENLDLGTPNDFLDVTPFAGGGPYDNFLIVSYTGTLIGAFSHVTPGITVSYATPGEIRISGTPIPEPGLTSMAFVSLMCLHRRRAGNLN